MTRLLGRLLAPIVEAACIEIRNRRANRADALGLTGLERTFYVILGGDDGDDSAPDQPASLTVRIARKVADAWDSNPSLRPKGL